MLVANNATDKTKVRNDIKKFHSVWFLEISKIVEIINTNFTKFMCSMGFAGEVQIIHKDEVRIFLINFFVKCILFFIF